MEIQQETGTGGESIWGEDFDNEVCEELLPLRGSFMYGKFRSRYEWKSVFIVQAKADTAKKGLEEGNVELTKKQQALFLDQGGYPSLNRKLYCVWTNDQMDMMC